MERLTVKKWLTIAGAAWALVVVLFAAAMSTDVLGITGEYPDPPFYRVSSSFPRLISVEDEPPASDAEAYERYRDQQQVIYQYRVYGGAMRYATENEREAVIAAYERKFIEAREVVSEVLKADPESIPGLYVLAQVEAFGESNLPYALFVIRKARHLVERRGRYRPSDLDACEWYIRILDVERDILEQMDRREEELRCVELLSEVYEPLPWLRIWPLIKLRRYDEARQAIETTLLDGRRKSLGYNGLCALEDKLGDRQGCLQASRDMVAAIEDSPVLWGNYGLSACNAFAFDEAEQAFLKSATMGPPDFFGTSYVNLAFLYIQQGRLTEALDALKRGQQQRADRPIYSLQQDQAKMEMTTAALMLAMGRARDAERFARRAVNSPDRAGATSVDERDLDVTGELLMWNVLTARREQVRELRGADDDKSWQETAEEQALNVERWRLTRRLRKQLVGEYLTNLLRPNVPGVPGFETGIGSWFSGSIVQLLPPGVASEAIRQAKRVEDMPQAAAYLDALDAEASLYLGRWDEAQRLAQRALENLPQQGERLLRARVEATAGEAAFRLGDVEQAMKHWDSVLRTFPHVFRLLQISLPVDIRHDQTLAAEKMAEALRKSTRLNDTPGGFLVQIRTIDDELAFEMYRLGQSRHFEDMVKSRGEGRASDEAALSKEYAALPEHAALAARAAAVFHQRLAQPRIDMSQSDIDSLDGSPMATEFRGRVDELLKP